MATKIVLELRGMTYKERLRALDLLTLEQKSEMGDLTQVYKLINGMDLVDNEDLLLRDEVISRSRRVYSKEWRGRCFKDMKKFQLSTKSIKAWNSLSENIMSAMSVHSFKEKLGNC